jgi:hypothetical protein
MSKDIVVPITSSKPDTPVFATAFSATHIFGAHLEFTHVHPDLQQALVTLASADMPAGASYERSSDRWRVIWPCARPFVSSVSESDCLCATSPPRTRPQQKETGGEARRVADLLVIGRARGREAVAIHVRGAAAMATDRPVFERACDRHDLH